MNRKPKTKRRKSLALALVKSRAKSDGFNSPMTWSVGGC